MNEVTLYGYQKVAVDKLTRGSISALADSFNSQQRGDRRTTSRRLTVLLKAPTGAGKTNILMESVEVLGEGNFSSENGSPSPAKPLVFLFLAPYLLHTQAMKRFRAAGFEDRGFSLRDLGEITSSTPLAENTILFFNYASVSQDKKNRSMRANEQQTDLPTILAKTREGGADIVLIVDEAHLNYMSVISQNLVKTIDPTVIFLATATPALGGAKKQTILPHDEFVEVTREQVIDEEAPSSVHTQLHEQSTNTRLKHETMRKMH